MCDLFNDKPLVSVIIPNYNHARYLDERIQSILNQTYQEFEVIILDDKSTDNSVEIINQYKKNPHISHIIVNDENSGSTFKQWQKGFELAKGELIWIAESDDKCDVTFLETLIRFFLQYSNCVLAYTRSVMFSGNMTLDGVDSQIKKPQEVLLGSVFIAERMAAGNAIVNASSAVFRKSIALCIDKQYTKYKGAGDRLFWIKIAEKGNVCIDYHSLNFFRIHSDNTTKRYYYEGTNQRDDFLILQYIRRKNYITDKQYKKSKRIYAKWNIFSDRLSPEHKKEISRLWGVGFWDRFLIHIYNLIEIINYKYSFLFK